jgi:LysR family transcriptional regulator, transcriptional activator for bauABCD operon
MPQSRSKREKVHDKLDWNLLKTFSAIVEAGGVSRAAQRLGRKQPTVSFALRKLEDQFDVRLCERGPSGFELTDQGKILAEACAQLSGVVRDVPDRIENAPHTVAGPVRIGLVSHLVNQELDKALVAFHAKYPKCEFLLEVATWHDVINALLRQEIDIGVAPQRSKRADLSYLPLFTEIHRPYCGRSHPLYGQQAPKPATLADYAFVLTGADEPEELSEFRMRFSLGRKVAGISPHLEEARRLAILGIGLCFLPELYAEADVAQGRLWPLLGKRNAIAMDIYVISNPNGAMHLSKLFFIEELRSVVAASQSRD